MTEHEKMEFWGSLGRLYDNCLALKDDCLALKDDCLALKDDCLALKEATTKLAEAARAHQVIAEAHERRLDRLDVVQQWLAEKERARENLGQ